MKILIVQTSFLGDTILSTPVIAALKKIHPDAELWMMTTPLSASLIKRDPLLKGIITYDKRNSDKGLAGLMRMRKRICEESFERIYSLHRSMRTAILLWLCGGSAKKTGFANASLNRIYHHTRNRNPDDHEVIRNLSILTGECSLDSLEKELRLFAPDKSELDIGITGILPEDGRYGVLIPGSAWNTKMWHWQGFRETARQLLSKGLGVILMGTQVDKEVSSKVAKGLNILDLTGKTGIDEAMYIMRNSTIAVCNDSMALHMASAFKIPCVAVFCSTVPSLGFGPWRNRAVVVEAEVECRPCGRHGKKKCPNGTEACMKNIPQDKVIQAVEGLLKN